MPLTSRLFARRRARGLLLPLLVLVCVLGGSLLAPAAKAALNDPPISRDNTYTTNEDTVAGGNVLTDDSGSGIDGDAEGDPLTAALISNPANGALSLNPDGSFTYTPGPNFNGSDSFRYLALDPASQVSAATYVGADYTTVASWRTTGVAKPLDVDSNNVYGTDGYYVVASGASRVVQPPYATIALRPGIGTFPGCGFCGGESGYALMDDPRLLQDRGRSRMC